MREESERPWPGTRFVEWSFPRNPLWALGPPHFLPPSWVILMQFLHEKNTAGQTLLRLCARGSAIVSELLRLAQNVPTPFLLASKHDQKKYGPLVIDFQYLDRANGKGPDFYDRSIEDNPVRLCPAPALACLCFFFPGGDSNIFRFIFFSCLFVRRACGACLTPPRKPPLPFPDPPRPSKRSTTSSRRRT